MHESSLKLFDLTGRVAIVTGGAQKGYGSQIVNALAKAGATVVITSRELKAAEQKAGLLKEQGASACGMELELKDENSIVACVQGVVNKFGRIDILFNNASDNHLEPFETVSIEDWNRVLNVNLTGTMLMCRNVAPHMLELKRGVIVNLSSIYGMVSPNHGIYGKSGINSPLVYGVTKAGIIQMTRYLATYWAPHIRVNSITPGGLFNDQDVDFVSEYTKLTPLGKMAGNRDLEGAALYLACDASGFVTGHNLVVDGGWTVW
jgi:NAD(P)-dependent dehydrogenase (short-subunit alcohol dehydrogenase family)